MQDKFILQKNARVEDGLSSAAEFMETHDVYFGQGTDNAWDESVALLLWAMDIKEDPGRDFLAALIPLEQGDKFCEAVRRRCADRVPGAYITGEAWFCGFRFYIDERVLVPRSPIAELIQNEYRPWTKKPVNQILDLCCGSGCIGLSAAMHNESAGVVLADLSEDALEVAQINLNRFDLEDRVNIRHGDLFDAVPNQTFDLILSNPPYVDAEDLGTMPDEYHREPAIGLGSGEDGLDITRRILRDAKNSLNEGGLLVLEVGNSWQNLERAYPTFPFTWVALATGGEGVAVLSYEELCTGPF